MEMDYLSDLDNNLKSELTSLLIGFLPNGMSIHELITLRDELFNKIVIATEYNKVDDKE